MYTMDMIADLAPHPENHVIHTDDKAVIQIAAEMQKMIEEDEKDGTFYE